MTRDYDRTVVLAAATIASGLVPLPRGTSAEVARESVLLARAIIAETQRTEPTHAANPPA